MSHGLHDPPNDRCERRRVVHSDVQAGPENRAAAPVPVGGAHSAAVRVAAQRAQPRARWVPGRAVEHNHVQRHDFQARVPERDAHRLGVRQHVAQTPSWLAEKKEPKGLTATQRAI